MDIQEMIGKAQALVSLPEIYYRVQEMLNDPDCDCTALARAIETDTGLTARVLRVANSPYYGTVGRVDRVSYAVTLLGSKVLGDIVLSTVILRAFHNISTKLVDMTAFWHHSLYCGLAARQFAKLKGVLHGERLLVAGVIHDVGELLFYQLQPELAKQALTCASNADDGMFHAEREIFGYTHSDVGAELLKAWNLPAALQEMVAFHHEPSKSSQFRLDTALLHLGNFVANRIEPGRQLEESQPVLDPMVWDITELSEQAIEPVINEANDRFLETLDMLMPGRSVNRR